MKDILTKRYFTLLLSVATAVLLAGMGGLWHTWKKSASVSSFSSLHPIYGGTFETTIPNTASAPHNAPSGMAWIPGGEFSLGAQDTRMALEGGHVAIADARPIHRVDGFWIDKTDVTNEQHANSLARSSI